MLKNDEKKYVADIQTLRETKKMIFALVVIALVIALYVTYNRKRYTKDAPKKKVRFNPVIEVEHAGGKKSDRYNPDLSDCVSRNASLAQSVGGAKKLVEIDLRSG
jgi:hypothetical protein